MPELPEVETVRRGLAPTLVGARIARVELRRADLRSPFPRHFAKRIAGARVEALTRRAKYLLARLDNGETLIMHLGMSGSLRIENGETLAPGAFHRERSKDPAHDHVVFSMEKGARIVYNDPRRFGLMDLQPTATLATTYFASLGAEPLAPDFDAAALARLFEGVRAPLKAALLDQSRIAGLGNIYVCEALFRAKLSPTRAAASIVGAAGKPTRAAKALAGSIVSVLEEAIAAGGSTLRDHRQPDGALGYFQHAFVVYGKEGAACPRPGCGGQIARVAHSGRSTFFCPKCQV
jgi:formamidopyrimidine-DNA glycosylase